MSGIEAALLLGCLHSTVLGVALYQRTRNRRANRYLAALLGALAVLLLDGYLRASGILLAHPHLLGLTSWVPFVTAPLLYLYVREMTAPEPERLPPAWRHFIVTGVYVVLVAIVIFPRTAAEKVAIAIEHHEPWFIRLSEGVVIVYGLGYVAAALALLRRHHGQILERYSNLAGVSLRWLWVLIVVNVAIWIVALISLVLRLAGFDAGGANVVVPLGSTAGVFVIGYFQLSQAEIYPRGRAPTPAPLPVPSPAPAPAPEPESPPEPPPPTYERARLAEDDATELASRIQAAMTERRMYQQPGLTLAELADAVAATPHEVSQVLSTRLQRNFYAFVNEHRVAHVKAALDASDRPVLDLALEAGFQSKSTFNTAFRKVTGLTPSEYRRRASA